MGADYSFYVGTIETHAHAFFKVIIFYIGSVWSLRAAFVSKILVVIPTGRIPLPSAPMTEKAEKY